MLERVLHLGELLEYPLLVLGGNADAGVRDVEAHRVFLGPEGRRHPHLAALRELQGIGDEVAEDLRHLALVGVESGKAVRRLEDETQRLADEERPQHAAQGTEHALPLELDGTNGDLARLHLGQIEEIVDELGEGMRSLTDKSDLLELFRGEGTVDAIEEEMGQRGDGVERGAELVAHVRQEARLELVGAPQMIRLLVELGVEGDHTPVRVFELAVEVLELLLAPAELIEGVDQLLVLPLDFLQRPGRHLPREGCPEAGQALGSEEGGARGEEVAENDLGALARSRGDLELVHQSPGSDDAETHAGRGAIGAVEDVGEPGDARALIGNDDLEQLRGRAAFYPELHLSSARIAEGVARDLRHRGGDPRLVLSIEAEEAGELPGPLPGEDDVVLELQRHRDHALAHAAAVLATTTVASSRPRLKSR